MSYPTINSSAASSWSSSSASSAAESSSFPSSSSSSASSSASMPPSSRRLLSTTDRLHVSPFAPACSTSTSTSTSSGSSGRGRGNSTSSDEAKLPSGHHTQSQEYPMRLHTWPLALTKVNAHSPLVCIVTGANSGIGRATATQLAIMGHHVFLACRNEAAALQTIHDIKRKSGSDRIEYLPLNLNSMQSVRQCAKMFLDRGLPLNVLINNAGIIKAKSVTDDGFQGVFGVNYLGHFLLTVLLLPRLRESEPAHIIHVSSNLHFAAHEPRDWQKLVHPTPGTKGFLKQLRHYEFSKLAQIAFSNELALRLMGTGVTSNSLNPGLVSSDLMRNAPLLLRKFISPFLSSPEEAAQSAVWLATSPSVGRLTGKYFEDNKVKHESKLAQNPAFREELWRHSIEWTRLSPDELQAIGMS